MSKVIRLLKEITFSSPSGCIMSLYRFSLSHRNLLSTSMVLA